MNHLNHMLIALITGFILCAGMTVEKSTSRVRLISGARKQIMSGKTASFDATIENTQKASVITSSDPPPPTEFTEAPASTAVEPFMRWTHPKYERSVIDTWWKDLSDSMVTIGDKGVQESHVNTILQFLYAHERLRIKFSTDKVNQQSIADSLMSNEKLSGLAEVLDIRTRGMMLGRKAGVKNSNFAVAKMETHELCLDFFSAGHTCKFGDRCKYSHDTNISAKKMSMLLAHMSTMKPKRVLNESLVPKGGK